MTASFNSSSDSNENCQLLSANKAGHFLLKNWCNAESSQLTVHQTSSHALILIVGSPGWALTVSCLDMNLTELTAFGILRASWRREETPFHLKRLVWRDFHPSMWKAVTKPSIRKCWWIEARFRLTTDLLAHLKTELSRAGTTQILTSVLRKSGKSIKSTLPLLMLPNMPT